MSGEKSLSAKVGAERKGTAKDGGRGKEREREGRRRPRKRRRKRRRRRVGEERKGVGNGKTVGERKGRIKNNCLMIFQFPWGLTLNYPYLTRMFHSITPQCPTNMSVSSSYANLAFTFELDFVHEDS